MNEEIKVVLRNTKTQTEEIDTFYDDSKRIVKLMQQVAGKDKKIEQLQETNIKLHRRCQAAESAAKVIIDRCKIDRCKIDRCKIDRCKREGVNMARVLLMQDNNQLQVELVQMKNKPTQPVKAKRKRDGKEIVGWYAELSDGMGGQASVIFPLSGGDFVDVKNNTCEKLAEDKEIEQLRKFAREIIQTYCWNLADPDAEQQYDCDGGHIQDLAARCGLIKPIEATAEYVSEEFDFDVGDIIYIFTEIMKETEQ